MTTPELSSVHGMMVWLLIAIPLVSNQPWWSEHCVCQLTKQIYTHMDWLKVQQCLIYIVLKLCLVLSFWSLKDILNNAWRAFLRLQLTHRHTWFASMGKFSLSRLVMCGRYSRLTCEDYLSLSAADNAMQACSDCKNSHGHYVKNDKMVSLAAS